MRICKKKEFIFVKYILVTAALITSCFIVTACNNSLSSTESGELRKRAYECNAETNTSISGLQICKNIERECQRREKAGQFDC
jgi:hypothetical protein